MNFDDPALAQVSVVTSAEVARLTVVGDVDLCSAVTLEAGLARALGDGAHSVVVALDRCDFFALSGYRALAEAAAVTRARGGEVVVRDAPASLRIIAGVVGDLGIVIEGLRGARRA
jgi:anti-anti-sigma factor